MAGIWTQKVSEAHVHNYIVSKKKSGGYILTTFYALILPLEKF